MSLSTPVIVGLSIAGALVLFGGIYVVTRDPAPAPAAGGGVVQPYGPVVDPNAGRDDTAQAVGKGIDAASVILGRLLPDRNADAARAAQAAERADNLALERERMALCRTQPTNPLCAQRAEGAAASRTSQA